VLATAGAFERSDGWKKFRDSGCFARCAPGFHLILIECDYPRMVATER
jgi:hypothetical protein